MSKFFSGTYSMIIGVVLTGIVSGIFTTSASAEVDVKEQPLKWIKPGTLIGKKPPAGWSHLIFAAYPRIGAGDVKEVGTTVKNIAKKFTISCVAKVSGAGEGGKKPYRLDEVRIGLGTLVAGKNTIISSEEQLGAKLGLIEGQVLRQCESDFNTGVIQVARTPTMCVFDNKAIILVDNEHRDMCIRFVIIASEETGQVGTLTWLFDEKYVLQESPMQYLPANFQEDRVMSVHADRFFLGLPQKGAIAQVKMAEGTPIPFTSGLKVVAANRRFTEETAFELEAELWKLWN